MEPDYLVQGKNPDSKDERRAWIREHVEEAKAEGCTFSRVSICPPGTWPNLNLILFEGWKEAPKDQGEPRWQLTATPQGEGK